VYYLIGIAHLDDWASTSRCIGSANGRTNLKEDFRAVLRLSQQTEEMHEQAVSVNV
jgi:hypothetical protein